MNLYLLNKQEEVINILSNRGNCPLLSSAIMTEELNGINTLEVELNSFPNIDSGVQEEFTLIFKDISQEWKEFIIKEITDVHENTFQKIIYAEDSSQELLDYIIEYELKGRIGTPLEFLTQILLGTRWEQGSVTSMPSQEFPYSTKNKSVLEVISLIAITWDLQIKYEVQIMGSRISRRVVNIVKNIGADIGKRFEYSKDIVKVERNIQSTDLKTAIIPIGGIPSESEDESSSVSQLEILKDIFQEGEEIKEENSKRVPINIVDIEWKKPQYPQNKPRGQNYIEIPEATIQWGYKDKSGIMKPRFIFYENTEITDPEELIADAYEVLLKISQPTINYKLDVIDLFALTGNMELSFETVKLGDIVTVIDKEFKKPIKIKTSIIKKEVDLLAPENTSIELGNSIRNIVDNESSSNVENILNKGLDKLEMQVVDVSNAFERFQKEYNSQEIDFNWIRNSDFRNNLKYWEILGDSSCEIIHIDDIAFFTQASRIWGQQYQVFNTEESLSLMNNNLTLSAFIKGEGHLFCWIYYKDYKGNFKWKKLNSNNILGDLWKRYSFSFALRKEFEMAEIINIHVGFNGLDGTMITGMMLNLGVCAGKYKVNTNDKYGKGFYDQVKELSNQEFKNSLGYVYLEEEDGLWVYDKPTSNRPMKMTALKGGMLGIGAWNLQTQQWDINTFIDGNMVNASCINTGTLNADLIRTGTLQSVDGTILININDGRFRLGGRNGDFTTISNSEVKVEHSSGAYTKISSAGMEHWQNGIVRPYKYINHMVKVSNVRNGTWTSIILPEEFNGKIKDRDFTVSAWAGAIDSNAHSRFQKDAVRNLFIEIGNYNSNLRTLSVRPCLQKIGIATMTHFGWDSTTTTSGNPIGEGSIDIFVLVQM